jgi:hypothetical protein
MKKTEFYDLNKPERGNKPDKFDINLLNENADIIDSEMKRQDAAFLSHTGANPIDHPDGSITAVKIRDNAVTDAKIGGRTVGAVSGTLQTLLPRIGERVREMQGTEAWTDAAPATLDEARAHIDDGENPHGVTKAQVGLGSVDNTSDMDKP